MSDLSISPNELYLIANLLRTKAEDEAKRAMLLDPREGRFVEGLDYYNPNIELARVFQKEADDTANLATRVEDLADNVLAGPLVVDSLEPVE